MKSPFQIISTKLLTTNQKQLFENVEVEDYSFIRVEVKGDFNSDSLTDTLIFTSQNAVKAVLQKKEEIHFETKNVFCVGEKTRALLQEQHIEVKAMFFGAKELAEYLVEEVKPTEVTFFCGNLRRQELSKILEENEIKVNEVIVYETILEKIKLNTVFDAVLFFSPSAIKSYILAENKINIPVFCIGNTTAVAATFYFDEIYVAEKPTVEEVIKITNAHFSHVK
ncbi:uroporphyrinogen-III synthase [Aureivirga marina]|uniref:uroporphyrinogen-III synthase n=1 Tax=Aureivirga marina TaxID=1182451 RepID=UPI0018CB0313|nr:uroporphyrinogen-III synthase [Aureivirga marina]